MGVLLEDGEILRTSTPVSVLKGMQDAQSTGAGWTVEAVHHTRRPFVLIASWEDGGPRELKGSQRAGMRLYALYRPLHKQQM